MKILWMSDSPFTTSSYALQSKLLINKLSKEHEFIYYGMTYEGLAQETNDYLLVGKNYKSDGKGLVNYYTNYFNPDIILTMKDPHAITDTVSKNFQRPWLAFCPVDTEPFNQTLKQYLKHASYILSPTFYNLEEIQNIHKGVFYTPHGIQDFYPRKNEELRQKLRIHSKDFVVSFVGDNKTSRKNIDSIIMAWRDFAINKEDVILYLHTQLDGFYNLGLMIEVLDMEKHTIRFTAQDEYYAGVTDISDIYAISNIYLNASGGEGFDLPLIEAQMSGVPIITNDFAAHKDTARVGWVIQDNELTWHNEGAFRCRTNHNAIVQSLEDAYLRHKDGTLANFSEAANEFATKNYDLNYVVDTYWKPMFKQVEVDICK